MTSVHNSAKVPTTSTSVTFVSNDSNKNSENKVEISTTNLAMSALVTNTTSLLSLDNNVSLYKSEEDIKNIMTLSNVAILKSSKKPPYSELSLSKKEEQLLNGFFSRWALNNHICLLELWGVDLFYHIEQIKTYIPAKNREKFLSTFASDFLIFYISIVDQINLSDENEGFKTSFFERGIVTGQISFYITKREYSLRLDDLMTSLKVLIGTKLKLKTIEKLFNDIKSRIDLGKTILLDHNASFFLVDNKVDNAGFPNSENLNNNDPKKTIEDLTTYVNFLSLCYQAAEERKIIGTKTKIFLELSKQIPIFSQKKNKLAAVKELKQKLSKNFSHITKYTLFLIDSIERVKSGKLTHKEFYSGNILKEKTQVEFFSQLCSYQMAHHLVDLFCFDCLEILDQQIMCKLDEDFIPTEMFIKRISLNRTSLEIIKTKLDINAPKNIFLPSNILTLSQKENLIQLLGAIQDDSKSIFMRAINHNKSFMSDPLLKMDVGTRIFFGYIIRLQQKKIDLEFLEEYLNLLSTHQDAHIKSIIAFLESLGIDKLRMEWSQWLNFFKENSFQNSLDFCRLNMFIQDLKVISSPEMDLSALNSEEHLLPPQLIDYMEMEGLEREIDKILMALPSAEASNTAATHKIRQKEDTVESESQMSAEEFRIRRGEKTRNVLTRLKEMGFIPSTARRGGTSHRKLINGETTTIIPVGSSHVHFKRGTAKSIQQQVMQNKK